MLQGLNEAQVLFLDVTLCNLCSHFCCWCVGLFLSIFCLRPSEKIQITDPLSLNQEVKRHSCLVKDTSFCCEKSEERSQMAISNGCGHNKGSKLQENIFTLYFYAVDEFHGLSSHVPFCFSVLKMTDNGMCWMFHVDGSFGRESRKQFSFSCQPCTHKIT